MNHSTPGLPVHHQLPEPTETHFHWVGDAIQPSHPLSSPSPPAPNPSQHQVFSSESTLRIRWPKYWSFSFNISPFNEYSGLISFRMDWLDLLAVQGTLKTLLQHDSSKASILRCSVFLVAPITALTLTPTSFFLVHSASVSPASLFFLTHLVQNLSKDCSFCLQDSFPENWLNSLSPTCLPSKPTSQWILSSSPYLRL